MKKEELEILDKAVLSYTLVFINVVFFMSIVSFRSNICNNANYKTTEELAACQNRADFGLDKFINNFLHP